MRSARIARTLTLAVAIVAVGIAFLALRPASTRGPVMRDFEAYYSAGAAWSVGDDPYSRQLWRSERMVPGVVATRDEILPYVGPPFALPLWAGFASFDYARATVVWGIVLAIAAAALAIGAIALAGKLETSAVLAALVFCAGFGPLTSGLALGQVAVLASAGCVIVLLSLRAGNIFAAAAGTLGAALQPNLGVALAARLGERRSFVALALGAAVALGGSLVAAHALNGFGHYLNVLRGHATAERMAAIQTTPTAIAYGFGAPDLLASAIAFILAILVIALLITQFVSRRYGGIERVALASCALPLAWPFAHEHDFVLVLFPALLCARRARGWLWNFAVLAALFIAVDWLGLAQRPTGLAQTAVLTLAAALALAALAPDPLRPLHYPPVAIVALVVAAGVLAAQHPMPIWPDALPASFHVARTVDVSTVWGLEEAATGLDARNPAWAFLRLLSLLGCGALWVAASLALASPNRGSRRAAPAASLSTIPSD